MNPEKYESQYVTMWVEEGILCAEFSKGLEMTLEIAKSCVEARIFFSKGKSYPLLVDMTEVKSMTWEARKYMASMGSTLVKAGALLTRSLLSRTVGNVFLKIDRPPVPVRLFTSKQNARSWLLQFVYNGIPV
jgi:hypothetical protein